MSEPDFTPEEIESRMRRTIKRLLNMKPIWQSNLRKSRPKRPLLERVVDSERVEIKR